MAETSACLHVDRRSACSDMQVSAVRLSKSALAHPEPLIGAGTMPIFRTTSSCLPASSSGSVARHASPRAKDKPVRFRPIQPDCHSRKHVALLSLEAIPSLAALRIALPAQQLLAFCALERSSQRFTIFDGSDALWCAREEEIALFERHDARDVLDELRNLEAVRFARGSACPFVAEAEAHTSYR